MDIFPEYDDMVLFHQAVERAQGACGAEFQDVSDEIRKKCLSE